jgi:alkylhydroperoxidase family enzyme
MVLGQSAGISDQKLRHLRDETLPEAVYTDDERAIIEYARRSTRMEPIDDDLYGRLQAHFDAKQLIVLCYIVGMANMTNRFHATFLTPLDERTHQSFVATGLLLPPPR